MPIPPNTPIPHLNDTGTFRRMFQLAYGLVGLLVIIGGALFWWLATLLS